MKSPNESDNASRVDWPIVTGEWQTTVLQEWFDQLEEVLTREARIAGLLQHGSLSGTAREFLVQRVLKMVLPLAVGLGTGKVIDAAGGSSRQIDIVVFDSRVPVFEVSPGIGLYPVEGVLATIEVKSRLDKKGLWESLTNSASVSSLKVGVGDVRRLNERTERLLKAGVDWIDAVHRTDFEKLPATYVFSLRGMQYQTLGKRMDEWFRDNGSPARPSPHLPRIVISDRAIAFLRDGYISIDPVDSVVEEAKQKGGPNVRLLFSACNTSRRFGWLLVHLLHTVSARLGAANAQLQLPVTIEHYLAHTAKAYYEEDLKDDRLFNVFWTPPDPRTA